MRTPGSRFRAALGGIGTSQEEQVADLISSGALTKPVIAYIGGRGARSGTRFSHAGAIIEGERGAYEKARRLREAGATVVDAFEDIPRATHDVLARLKIAPKEQG